MAEKIAQGERELARAVLEQAVSDAMMPGAGHRVARLRNNARDWLDGKISAPFSAELLCDALGVSREAIVQQVREGKPMHLKKRAYSRYRDW